MHQGAKAMAFSPHTTLPMSAKMERKIISRGIRSKEARVIAASNLKQKEPNIEFGSMSRTGNNLLSRKLYKHYHRQG